RTFRDDGEPERFQRLEEERLAGSVIAGAEYDVVEHRINPLAGASACCSSRGSALRVVHELAELLLAAAGPGDLRGPLDRRLARWKLQDTEAAIELLGLRIGRVRRGAVGGNHERADLVVDAAAEHV